MRRFDRAMYAMFLLVLLADIARVHASIPVEGDLAGGLILGAAGQIHSDPAGAILGFRGRSGSSAEAAGFKILRLSFSGWSKRLSYQPGFSGPDLAASAVFTPGASPGVVYGLQSLAAASSAAIFAHIGSPAP